MYYFCKIVAHKKKKKKKKNERWNLFKSSPRYIICIYIESIVLIFSEFTMFTTPANLAAFKLGLSQFNVIKLGSQTRDFCFQR